MSTPHERLIRAGDIEKTGWIAECFHVGGDLLKLLRHRGDLLELVVYHLDILREIDDVIRLVVRDSGRIDDDYLGVRQRSSD
jgi:hypothetical protein